LSLSYKKILNLPDRVLLEKKLTKAFFLKNFELSASEKKVLNSSIAQMEWLASIKPNNSNIQSIINEQFAFEEVQIMICTIGDEKLDAIANTCIQLFQKYIPYQMLLIVEIDQEFIINVCEKRINQNDKTKRTIEKQYSTKVLSKLFKDDTTDAFLKSIDFAVMDKTNLESFYQSYINSIIQLNSASVTGVFQKRTNTRTKENLELLNKMEELEKDISKLANQIKAEKQQSQKVTLNIAIHQKKKQVENIKNQLSEI
jgi:hypothetical protein